MVEEEIPPQWMWHLDHELDQWFKEVTRKREEKYSGNTTETVDMMSNEYTKGLK